MQIVQARAAGPETLDRPGRKAEQAGFESAWVAETRITRDAVTAMTALLLGTQNMRVGSAAINVFTASKEFPGVNAAHNGGQGTQCIYGTWTFAQGWGPAS